VLDGITEIDVGQSSPLAFPFEAKSQLASSHQSDLRTYAGQMMTNKRSIGNSMQRYNNFLKYANLIIQKHIFLQEKRAYACIYAKKIVILQRKIIKTEKYARD